MLNNRDLATIIWLTLAIIFVLGRADVRRSLRGVARAAFHWKILLTLAAMSGYVIGLLGVGRRVGWWDVELTKDTVVWFLGTSLVLLFSLEKVAERGYFQTVMARTVKASVFIEFFLNLFVFPLLVELVLVPSVVLLAMMSTVAGLQQQYRNVKRLVDSVLALVGLLLAIYFAVRLVGDWGIVTKHETTASLLLPVWMTVGVLPLIFLIAVVTTYETAFLRLDLATESMRAPLYTKLALAASLRFNLADLTSFAGGWPRRAASASSFGDARRVAQEFRRSRQAEKRRADQHAAEA